MTLLALPTRVRVLPGAAVVALLFAVTASACSSSNSTPGPATCDSSKCLPGNTCLALDGVVACRKTCSSNVDPSKNCPFGYTCVEPSYGAAAFCVKDNTTLTKAPKGQWGAPCAATGGVSENPDCDSAQGFNCYGKSPTDGAAYCTRYDCQTDRDCAAGFYCGDANVSPNVEDNSRSIGETQRVCLRRDYCAPCSADLDCPPLNGVPQHCFPDDNNVGYCTPECQSNKNCNKEAQCLSFDGMAADGGTLQVCYPRAGSCTGDGSLCAPCRSDKDCGTDGVCVQGQFTTEKSCAKPSTIPCKYDGNNAPVAGKDFACPAVTSPEKVKAYCLGKFIFPEVPKDFCHGVYAFGESIDVGCWTPAKK